MGLKAEVRQSRFSQGRQYYSVHLLLAAGNEIIVDWYASREVSAQDVADRIQKFVRPGHTSK